jgi:hypothetical protein
MQMNCEGFQAEEYAFYVLGTLEGDQHDAIDEHLASDCASCKSELAQYRGLWSSVGATTPIVAPSRKLRNRVIQSVGGRPSWWAMPVPLLAGAAALLFGVAGGLFMLQRPVVVPAIAFSPTYRVELPTPAGPTPSPQTVIKQVPVPVEKTVEKLVDNPAQAAAIAVLNQDLARERQRATELSANLASAQRALADARPPASDQQRQLASLTARTQELERQVAQYRVLLETERKRADQSLLLASMVSDPSLRVVKLRATEKNQTVEGHALIAGNSQMMFYASQLPALPANRVYQLWLIRANGQAIASAGIFTPDGANRGALQLKNPTLLSGVTTVAVTDEPAGGSMQPTGHKWLIGS